MEVLQTSDRHDVKPSAASASRSINERLSLPMPYKTPFSPDLAAVIDAWDRLPEAIRAGILAMVKAASSAASR